MSSVQRVYVVAYWKNLVFLLQKFIDINAIRAFSVKDVITARYHLSLVPNESWEGDIRQTPIGRTIIDDCTGRVSYCFHVHQMRRDLQPYAAPVERAVAMALGTRDVLCQQTYRQERAMRELLQRIHRDPYGGELSSTMTARSPSFVPYLTRVVGHGPADADHMLSLMPARSVQLVQAADPDFASFIAAGMRRFEVVESALGPRGTCIQKTQSRMDLWLIGGGAEANETPVETVFREAWEEARISAEAIGDVEKWGVFDTTQESPLHGHTDVRVYAVELSDRQYAMWRSQMLAGPASKEGMLVQLPIQMFCRWAADLPDLQDKIFMSSVGTFVSYEMGPDRLRDIILLETEHDAS